LRLLEDGLLWLVVALVGGLLWEFWLCARFKVECHWDFIASFDPLVLAILAKPVLPTDFWIEAGAWELASLAGRPLAPQSNGMSNYCANGLLINRPLAFVGGPSTSNSRCGVWVGGQGPARSGQGLGGRVFWSIRVEIKDLVALGPLPEAEF